MLKANANVPKVLLENFAIKSIALIQLVQITDFVWMDLVFAKKAGKVWIAASWMKRPVNAFLIVQVTEFLTLKPNNVVVSKAGLETIVDQNCATLIVVHMAGQFTC